MPFGLPYDSGEMAEVLRQRGSLEAQIGQTQARFLTVTPDDCHCSLLIQSELGWS